MLYLKNYKVLLSHWLSPNSVMICMYHAATSSAGKRLLTHDSHGLTILLTMKLV